MRRSISGVGRYQLGDIGEMHRRIQTIGSSPSLGDSAGANPLRFTMDRVWFYAACCVIVVSLPFVTLGWFQEVAYIFDFACFWSAGANAGTAILTDPARLNAWAKLHHMTAQPFSYPPGFAYMYAPLSHLPPLQGLLVEELAMTALFIVAALIAARTYGFNRWFSIAAVLAWAPAVSAIETGQNTGIALALTFLTCWALVNRRGVVAGVAVGLLLYKPTLALPLLVLLAARREWRALAIVVVSGFGWYALSAAASGGDWKWPTTYLHTMSWWLPMDFAAGADKAFSIPTVLMSLGLNFKWAWAVAIAVLLIAVPIMARVSALQAASLMPLVGLAASVHAWPYDLSLALPSVFYAMKTLAEPPRTAVIASLYVLVAFGTVLKHGGLILAPLCIGAVLVWFWTTYRAIPGAAA